MGRIPVERILERVRNSAIAHGTRAQELIRVTETNPSPMVRRVAGEVSDQELAQLDRFVRLEQRLLAKQDESPSDRTKK